MGPPPRSLTAEANSCFMVRVPHGPNRIQGCGASIAPERGLPSDQLYRTSNNEGHRVAVTLDTKVLIQGCVKTFFRPQKLHATGDDPRRHDGLSVFCCIESGVNPSATSGYAERPERSHDAHNSTSSSRPDCYQERLDADDVHYAREVVGEYVQRHFGRDIGQPFH